MNRANNQGQKNSPDTAPTREGEQPDPIMDQLKQVYDDIAAEPLPDHLLNLLAQLDEAERKR